MGISIQFGDRILPGEVCDVTRLIKLLPLTTEENRDELFEMACHIPDAKGFDANIRNLRGKLAPDDPHTHEFEPIPYAVCVHCKQRVPIKVLTWEEVKK
jgi:hypothetical protein